MNDLYITPITTNLEKYTFRQSNQLYQQTGCIGYLRADLGSSGKEFHSSWNDTCSFFKTDEFKKEFDDVINALRLDDKYGKMLGDRTSLSKYCHENAKQFCGDDKQYFGVRVDTDNHTYLLRLNPNRGEYNLYCYCYVKKYLETHLVQASKGIRFITPHYREIFRIPDGDKIKITHSDGERSYKTCRYIDDYHTEVGDRLYHICEFAELMERNGSTVIPIRSSLPKLCYAIHPESEKLITHFISGMALGVDMIAAEMVLELKKKYQDITLECAIPCETQANKWTEKYRDRYFSIIEMSDKETLLQTHYTADCMHKRNRYMVDKSDYVIAVWNGSPSGTGKTVLYAKENNKQIIQIKP